RAPSGQAPASILSSARRRANSAKIGTSWRSSILRRLKFFNCSTKRSMEVRMAKPAIIVVGADKGGVGKTTVARTLLDYFTAHHVPTRAFDTEAPKGTLKRFHP